MREIERDLIRWQRGKWIAVIAFIFVLQVGLIIGGTQKEVRARQVYPSEPTVAFAPPLNELDPMWLDENPFLFAAASWNGFSGEAWLRQPRWEVPEAGRRSAPTYLQMTEAREINPRQDAQRPFTLQQRRRTTPVYEGLATAQPKQDRTSRLKLEGFDDRSLAAPLPLPEQFHGDVLSPTTVETMIDRDGLVISARIIDHSGSPKADSDALALARQARFSPLKSGENIPEVGKLIFEWFALSLSHTNNVKR